MILYIAASVLIPRERGCHLATLCYLHEGSHCHWPVPRAGSLACRQVYAITTHEAFLLFDTNGDGQISRQEFRDVLLEQVLSMSV